MGQANSSRERHKSGDIPPCSPGKEGSAFIFDKKSSKLLYQTSGEDDDFLNTKGFEITGAPGTKEFGQCMLSRSAETTPTPVTENKVLPTVFKWDGGGKSVHITGTFSNWKTIPMVKSHGDFVTIVDLPEGEHQYKFLVDGEWMHDPTEPVIDNGIGSKNNVINVKKTDFEVFDALEMDGSNVGPQTGGDANYGQEIPTLRPQDKATPPILPPHLLQVILNKDTPLSCEPTLLPEPNHVMLNHLYALSIKDGVMVLSATHRYRKKYVTTLLYKPI